MPHPDDGALNLGLGMLSPSVDAPSMASQQARSGGPPANSFAPHSYDSDSDDDDFRPPSRQRAADERARQQQRDQGGRSPNTVGGFLAANGGQQSQQHQQQQQPGSPLRSPNSRESWSAAAAAVGARPHDLASQNPVSLKMLGLKSGSLGPNAINGNGSMPNSPAQFANGGAPSPGMGGGGPLPASPHPRAIAAANAAMASGNGDYQPQDHDRPGIARRPSASEVLAQSRLGNTNVAPAAIPPVPSMQGQGQGYNGAASNRAGDRGHNVLSGSDYGDGAAPYQNSPQVNDTISFGGSMMQQQQQQQQQASSPGYQLSDGAQGDAWRSHGGSPTKPAQSKRPVSPRRSALVDNLGLQSSPLAGAFAAAARAPSPVQEEYGGPPSSASGGSIANHNPFGSPEPLLPHQSLSSGSGGHGQYHDQQQQQQQQHSQNAQHAPPGYGGGPAPHSQMYQHHDRQGSTSSLTLRNGSRAPPPAPLQMPSPIAPPPAGGPSMQMGPSASAAAAAAAGRPGAGGPAAGAAALPGSQQPAYTSPGFSESGNPYNGRQQQQQQQNPQQRGHQPRQPSKTKNLWRRSMAAMAAMGGGGGGGPAGQQQQQQQGNARRQSAFRRSMAWLMGAGPPRLAPGVGDSPSLADEKREEAERKQEYYLGVAGDGDEWDVNGSGAKFWRRFSQAQRHAQDKNDPLTKSSQRYLVKTAAGRKRMKILVSVAGLAIIGAIIGIVIWRNRADPKKSLNPITGKDANATPTGPVTTANPTTVNSQVLDTATQTAAGADDEETATGSTRTRTRTKTRHRHNTKRAWHDEDVPDMPTTMLYVADPRAAPHAKMVKRVLQQQRAALAQPTPAAQP